MDDTPFLDEIVKQITEDLFEKYKIELEQANALVKTRVSEKINEIDLKQFSSIKQIRKTRWFKTLNDTIKREVYYCLRKYKAKPEHLECLIFKLDTLSDEQFNQQKESILKDLATCHVSIYERLTEMDYFYQELFDCLSKHACTCRTVLDVGCGLQPLFFPFQRLPYPLLSYTAIDKDPLCIAAINAFSQHVVEFPLKSYHWQISDGWEPILSTTAISSYDLAFVLKFIPVVERTEKGALEKLLLSLPAKIWVISGAKEAMAKRRNIEKRERASIENHITRLNKTIIAEINITSEFFYIVSD